MSTLWLLLGSEVSTSKHDLFKHRECRQRRGDVADIPNLLTAAPSHPRNLKVNSEKCFTWFGIWSERGRSRGMYLISFLELILSSVCIKVIVYLYRLLLLVFFHLYLESSSLSTSVSLTVTSFLLPNLYPSKFFISFPISLSTLYHSYLQISLPTCLINKEIQNLSSTLHFR